MRSLRIGKAFPNAPRPRSGPIPGRPDANPSPPARRPAWGAYRIGAATFAGGVAIWLYSLAKAIRIPITFDEAYTYLVYVRAPLDLILPIHPTRALPPLTANNHVLNSVLAKVAAALAGPSPLALRSPNLGAHAVFLVATYWIVKRYFSGASRLFAFLVVACNPLQIELFSLCRGYGISVAAMMAALVPLVVFFENPLERRHAAALSTGIFIVGVLASYVLLDALAGLMIAIGVALAGAVARGPEPSRRRFALRAIRAAAPSWGIALVSVGALWPALSILRRRRLGFSYGGLRGFWHDTASSLVAGSVDHPAITQEAATTIGVGVGVTLLLLCIAALSRSARGAPARSVFFGLLILTIASAEIHVVLHAVDGTPFLQGRTAVYLVPLTAITFCLGVASLPPGAREAMGIALGLFAGTVWLHLWLTAHLDYSSIWKIDADTPQMLDDLRALDPRANARSPIRLGTDWLFMPSVEFYRQTEPLPWLAPVTRDNLWNVNDYVFLAPRDFSQATTRGVKILRIYALTGNALGLAPRGP